MINATQGNSDNARNSCNKQTNKCNIVLQEYHPRDPQKMDDFFGVIPAFEGV